MHLVCTHHITHRTQHSEKREFCFTRNGIGFKPEAIGQHYFSTARMHRSGSKSRNGEAPLTITSNNIESLLRILATLSFADVVVLAVKRGVLSSGDTMVVPLDLKRGLPPGHLGLFISPSQHAKNKELFY